MNYIMFIINLPLVRQLLYEQELRVHKLQELHVMQDHGRNVEGRRLLMPKRQLKPILPKIKQYINKYRFP